MTLAGTGRVEEHGVFYESKKKAEIIIQIVFQSHNQRFIIIY